MMACTHVRDLPIAALDDESIQFGVRVAICRMCRGLAWPCRIVLCFGSFGMEAQPWCRACALTCLGAELLRWEASRLGYGAAVK